MNAENSSDRGVPSEPIADPMRAQISALVDGELDDAGAERAIDALLASDALVGFWADCHRAGDWMRSDEVVGVGDGAQFMQRFSARLASEPTVLAPMPARSRSGGFWIRTGLPGVSIAAALVAVVWVASPFGRDEPADKLAIAAPSRPVVPVVAAAVVADPAPTTVDADQLSDYFAAHRDVTPFGYRGASARPAAYSPPANPPAP
jgi:sigma-E factor negative regulatory protein RseA